MPELDINASADEVVALLNRGQNREAAARLDALRQDQSVVVQEALDRYVAVRGQDRLTALRAPNALTGDDATALNPTLDRLRTATAAPRFPAENETATLSQAQQYDVYASVIAARGTQAARDALGGQDRVILGMRNETQTTQNSGRGQYDDRMVVVWRDADGGRHAREFNQVTTEPTAQYDHHAGSDGNRIYADTQRQAPRLAASPGYENVRTRKIEGDDVNGDRVRDMGRLSEGTVEMVETVHASNGHTRNGREFSLRPSDEAVRNGANRVERDTNADGWFDSRDVNGVQDLNNTFKIHRGSNTNTDSAGCQTIGGGEHTDFINTVRGNPNQDRWQYVLTSVAPGQQQERNQATPAQDGQARPPADPRNADHPDHRLYTQIDGHVRGLGTAYERNHEAVSLHLLAEAKRGNLTQVDAIATNNATANLRAGETLFLVQGRPGDPAAARVSVSADAATHATPEASLNRLDAINRTQAANQPTMEEPQRVQQQEPLQRRAQ
ncbi:XVIPCD domain-containing protein [Lysobacter silvisoli]|uniref:XVIPCD domain-containing protein n=1 Tax=Lysobacter silvisoli TaxID=2293254 RepID=UPI001E332EF2|nr:XVIPCD domain-containing protein [Lysobacter silvisoli]